MTLLINDIIVEELKVCSGWNGQIRYSRYLI